MTTAIAAEEPDPRKLGYLFEQMINEWNLAYKYEPAFPLANLKNAEWTQVREAANVADPATVSEYAIQMENGAVFPPLVVWGDVLVDGNGRTAAAKKNRRKTLPAYVVEIPTTDLASAFAAALNQVGGRRLTPSEAENIAVTMLERGIAVEAIARAVGRSPSTVKQLRSQRDFDRRASDLGIKAIVEKLPKSHKVVLASIGQDPAFVEAAKLVGTTKNPPVALSKDLAKEIGRGRSDREQIEAVRRIADEVAPAGPVPRVMIAPELQMARRMLGGLVSVAARPQVLLDLATPEKRKASKEQWQTVRDLADKVLALYGED